MGTVLSTAVDEKSEKRDITGSQEIKTFGGNSNGVDCVFPFKFEELTYDSCIRTEIRPQLWCSTTSNYDSHPMWGYCCVGDICNPHPKMHVDGKKKAASLKPVHHIANSSSEISVLETAKSSPNSTVTSVANITANASAPVVPVTDIV